jgi:hypothetical protein
MVGTGCIGCIMIGWRSAIAATSSDAWNEKKLVNLLNSLVERNYFRSVFANATRQRSEMRDHNFCNSTSILKIDVIVQRNSQTYGYNEKDSV